MSTSPRRQPALRTRRGPLLGAATALVATLLTPVLAAAHPIGPVAAKPHGQAHVPMTIAVLPRVYDPGGEATAMEDALSVVAVTLRPRTLVRKVKLQRHVGLAWHTVAIKTTHSGEARFPVPNDASAVYRAVLPASGGRPAQRSRIAVDKWGGPDFADEFDAPTLSPIWEHRIQFYNPWGGRACSKGSPDAVIVDDGVLRLSSMPDPSVHKQCRVKDRHGRRIGRFPCRLNGHISTEHSADFLYGVAAARMRFPRSPGQHAAFWLQPRGLLDDGPTPWGAEIDVVEWYGARKGRHHLASAVHAPMADGTKKQIGGRIPNPGRFLATRSDTWWRQFHVFSVEWTPGKYVFRIDGHVAWRTRQGVSQVPEFLILSMLSSDFELPLVGDDPTPRTAEVDWVAFWQA